MQARGPNIPPPRIWHPPAVGEYTTGMYNHLQAVGATASANRLYAIPCVLPVRSSYSDISVHVDVGNAGASARMGVYADNGSLRPGALIEDVGVFAPTAAAFHDVSFAADLALGTGIVWLALVTDDAVVQWERSSSEPVFSIRIQRSGTDYKWVAYCWVAHAFGALPADFGSPTCVQGDRPWRLVLKGA